MKLNSSSYKRAAAVSKKKRMDNAHTEKEKKDGRMREVSMREEQVFAAAIRVCLSTSVAAVSTWYARQLCGEDDSK